MSGRTDAEKVSEALLAMSETYAPLYEAAEGQRAELERRGWSPSAAESVALEILHGMLRQIFRGHA